MDSRSLTHWNWSVVPLLTLKVLNVGGALTLLQLSGAGGCEQTSLSPVPVVLYGATHQQTRLFIDNEWAAVADPHTDICVCEHAENIRTKTQTSKSASSQKIVFSSISERLAASQNSLCLRKSTVKWSHDCVDGCSVVLMCAQGLGLKWPLKSRTCRRAENSWFDMNAVTQASDLKLMFLVFQPSKPRDPELCSRCGLWAPAAVYSASSVNDRGTIWSLLLMKCRKAGVTVQQMMGPCCRETQVDYNSLRL